MPSVRQVTFRGTVEYTLREDPDSAVFFVLGVRKSGSSVLNNIVHSLARYNGLNYVDVAGKLFERGVPVAEWQNDPALLDILAPGNVYGGFRDLPSVLLRSPVFGASRKILLVRHPRDALVSEFFSNLYSHSIPADGKAREAMLNLREAARKTAIDAYVLSMAPSMKRVLSVYMTVARDANLRLFRYEDVIFEKARWIADICEAFGWSIPDEERDHILAWADVLPAEERPTEFIRRVTPGDAREKLTPETIARLDGIFSEELAHFGYEIG